MTTPPCLGVESDDVCIDSAIIVFLAVVLLGVVVFLIGPGRVLKWLCCCLRCSRGKQQITEEEEEAKEEDGAATYTQQPPPRYEEAVNMATTIAAVALHESSVGKDEAEVELPPPDYETVRGTST